MTVLGLHHITIGSADAQRTIDFYVGVLGLRFVKRTVNFDDPTTYHLYFGDEQGSPGTAITFFEWPGAPRGRWGIGGTHHFAMTVNDGNGLRKWKRYLSDRGIHVSGPYSRVYFESIYFADPDGTILEIATKGPGFMVDEPRETVGTQYIEPTQDFLVRLRDEDRIKADTWNEPVPEITPDMALNQGMHHISAISSNLERTAEFYEAVLDMKRIKMTANYDDPTSQHWYWSVGGDRFGTPGTLITYFGRDASKERRMQMGAGQTHHFALAVENEAMQLEWRNKLVHAGYRVSPVMDRVYFKSIYTNDPDGHIVELATLGPGFPVDEAVAELGKTLKLPSWLEQHRKNLELGLRPIMVPEWKKV
ncbi:MAG: VOC family protein [Anaerolineae bacterium]